MTSEINVLTWESGRIPFGVTPAKRDSWAFGYVPPKLYTRMRDQVLAHRKRHSLRAVRRDSKNDT